MPAPPFDVAWLVNGEEDTAPGPPARIIEEIAMAGAAPKNSKPARRGGGSKPKDNPLSLMGWFISAVIPLLSAAFVSWLDAKEPKFWKKLKPKHRGILLMIIAAGAHYLEQFGQPSSGGKAGEFDKEKALALHDLGVTCTALAARYFFQASQQKKAETPAPDQVERDPNAPPGSIDGQQVQQMIGQQLRQVVSEVMRNDRAPVAGFNVLAEPGLHDDLFAPDVTHALEALGRMAA